MHLEDNFGLVKNSFAVCVNSLNKVK